MIAAIWSKVLTAIIRPQMNPEYAPNKFGAEVHDRMPVVEPPRARTTDEAIAEIGRSAYLAYIGAFYSTGTQFYEACLDPAACGDSSSFRLSLPSRDCLEG